jgi:phosphatidyl-myo-inositol dimannoside synthase
MAPRLRALLVTPDFPPAAGGIQLLLSRIVERSEGIDFRVLTLGQGEAGEWDADFPAAVARVGNAGGDRRLAALRLNARSLAEARRFRPDVIVSGHAVASLGAIALRRTLGVPFVQYVHADEFRVRAGITGAAVRAADATIAVSEYTRGMALDAGADPARVRVIHPGIDLPEPSTAPRDPATLLTVATLLFRYKGHDVMVRALPLIAAKVADVRWVVVGDGPFRPALEAAVHAYGLEDRVDLRGRVSDEERDDWLARATVFAMPSRVPAAGLGGEGFGIAYMEAEARGIPVIGGDLAGARDSVVNGETGLLIDPADHLAVAGAATELLTDPERAATMGAAARRYAERHAWPLIVAEVDAVLAEVAARRRGR